MRALILGGGVAGLASALALTRRAQIEKVLVFEQDTKEMRRARRGHGLILMQNGVLALRALGAEGVLRGCRPLDRTELRDTSGGLIETDSLEGVYCVARVALVDALRAALHGGAAEEARRCERVLVERGGGERRARRVIFTDGTSLDVTDDDLLVGAEGYRSRLCEALNPGLERPLSRVLEIVTSTRLPGLAAALGSRFVKTLFPERGAAFGLLSPDTDRVIGFLQFDSERHPTDTLTPATMLAFVRRVLGGAPPLVDEYLRAADFSTAHLWRPVNADLPPNLHGSNAVLLGDAAHPVLPFTSQGVSAALEDAVLLGDALAEAHGDARLLPPLLSSFAARRRTSLAPLIEGGRRLLGAFLEQEATATAPYLGGDVSDFRRMIAVPGHLAEALFHAADANKDGVLSEEEARDALAAALPGRAPASLAGLVRTLDRNEDGVLQQDEFLRALLGQGGDPTLENLRAQLSPQNVRRALRSLERPAPASQDALFDDDQVNLPVLRERAFNYRWAVQDPDVIPLTAADPDFPVAPAILDGLLDYLAPGYLPYSPPAGLPSWRASAARFFRTSRCISCDEGQVFTTDSAASGLYLAARWALGDGGGEILIPDPVDFLFERSILAAGGHPRRVPLRPALGGAFDLDELEAAISPGKTRALMLCNPHNPLGRVLTRTELLAVADLALRHNLWIISDEVWADIVYAPHTHLSVASLDEEVARRTLTVYGFSKGFGLAGLRLGALLCPSAQALDEVVRLSHADETAYGVSVLSQIAGAAALDHAGPWQQAFLRHLRARRDEAVQRLNAIEGVSCRSPEGTYVVFPDVSALGVDIDTLVEALRVHHRIAVVPGNPRFFGPGAAGHIRLSFATSRRLLSEGLDRLERGLRALRR